MDPMVDGERRSLNKCFPTNVAKMRLVAAMNALC